MQLYVGCVILESLQSMEPLIGWKPIAERVIDMPNDPDATVWQVCWYQIDEKGLNDRLASLAQAMRPQWYAHFWAGDSLCVILSGKFFWAKASDKATWQAFIDYGDSAGIARKWTEGIPTDLPPWVQAALAPPVASDFYCDQVLSGQTPVEVVAQTERVLAFHHTQPAWDIHIIIIPKEHLRTLTDVQDKSLLAELLSVAQGIIADQRFNDANYKLITNGGAYQSSQHLHFHLVSGSPRDANNPAQQGELRL